MIPSVSSGWDRLFALSSLPRSLVITRKGFAGACLSVGQDGSGHTSQDTVQERGDIGSIKDLGLIDSGGVDTIEAEVLGSLGPPDFHGAVGHQKGIGFVAPLNFKGQQRSHTDADFYVRTFCILEFF